MPGARVIVSFEWAETADADEMHPKKRAFEVQLGELEVECFSSRWASMPEKAVTMEGGRDAKGCGAKEPHEVFC